MEIKVLGTGCSNCKALYANVEKVMKDMDINAVLVKEEDLQKIMEYNVMSLPALVIDGKVVAKGRITESEIRNILTTNK
ncbi:thioredoxin family protein [Xylanibacter oryzae]|jgi:small redox-active disulfide protein 2|uniref:thioredoxin family protein n=1 Tax=Xylanibacter oryzae TaxID=185293 RepID=UPI0004AF7946|nr:thioredoxin family protein [Xylanibacter oryzae]